MDNHIIDLIAAFVFLVAVIIAYMFLSSPPQRSGSPANPARVPPRKIVIDTKAKDGNVNINNMVIGNEINKPPVRFIKD